MEHKNGWSQMATDSTRNNFANLGASFMKSCKEPFFTIGFDTSLYVDEECKVLIPESEAGKKVVLFRFASSRGLFAPGCPVTEPVFYKAYDSIDDMIDDGWVLD